MATSYEFNRDQANQGFNTGQQQATHAFQNAQEATQQGFHQAQNAAQQGFNQAQQFADQFRHQSEEAVRQGQQAWSQATERSREVMDRGMKALDDFNSHARGNADAWMRASRAATEGLEAIVHQTSEFGRKSFEQATAALRQIASARTPADVFAAQNEYVKAAFDNMVQGYSRLTETVLKVSGDVTQPLQSQFTETAHRAGEVFKHTTNAR